MATSFDNFKFGGWGGGQYGGGIAGFSGLQQIPQQYDANGYLIGGSTTQAQKDAIALAAKTAQMNGQIARNQAGIKKKAARSVKKKVSKKKSGGFAPVSGYMGASSAIPGISYGGIQVNAPSRDSFRKQAANTVAFQLNPQINSLISQRNATNKDWAFADTTLRRRGSQAKSDLNYLKEALNRKLGSLKSENDATLQQGMSAVDANYAQLEQAMATTNQATNQATSDEVNRMGLTTNQDVQATQRATEDQQFFANLEKNNRVNAATLLQAQKSSYDSAATDTIAAENINFTNQQATVANTYAQAESELLRERNKTLAAISQNKQAVEAQRGFLTQERIDSLYGEAMATAERRAQQDWTNQMAANNFNLNVTKANYDTQYKQATLARDKARLELDAAKASGANKANTDKIPPYDRGLGMITAKASLNGNDPMAGVAVNIFDKFTRGDLAGVPMNSTDKNQILNSIRGGSSGISDLNGLNDDQRVDVLRYLGYGLDAYWGK
jgi:hypothetical protein